MSWDDFKTKSIKVLKCLAIPFIIIGTFVLKAFINDRDSKNKEKIKDLEKQTGELKKKTSEAKEDLSKKQDQLDKSISNVEKDIGELKANKEERDNSAKQFFK